MSRAPDVLPRYVAEAGVEYFMYFDQGSNLTGRLNAPVFAPHVRSTDVVLDFGCGGGSLLRSLDCARRIGVEANPAAHDTARTNGVEVHASIDEIPLGAVDVAISNHALEHVAAPLHTLVALRQRIAPGGTLVLCVPINDWRNERRVDPADINQHLYTWTPLLLGNLLTAAGFRDPVVHILTRAWPPGWRYLSRLPQPIWNALCHATARLRRHREMLAVARV